MAMNMNVDIGSLLKGLTSRNKEGGASPKSPYQNAIIACVLVVLLVAAYGYFIYLPGQEEIARKQALIDSTEEMRAEVLVLTEEILAKQIQLQEDKEIMKEVPINNQRAWETMGVLFGKGIINTPQISIMRKEWKNPSHQDFDDDSLWSLYNAGTEALKTCSPTRMMSSHIKLHRELTALA